MTHRSLFSSSGWSHWQGVADDSALVSVAVDGLDPSRVCWWSAVGPLAAPAAACASGPSEFDSALVSVQVHVQPSCARGLNFGTLLLGYSDSESAQLRLERSGLASSRSDSSAWLGAIMIPVTLGPAHWCPAAARVRVRLGVRVHASLGRSKCFFFRRIPGPPLTRVGLPWLIRD
jgi:hypothetical protein